ncbi:hypothetical protein EBU94_01030 [bacterium]|nr:hypothetical protein [bacterium]
MANFNTNRSVVSNWNANNTVGSNISFDVTGTDITIFDGTGTTGGSVYLSVGDSLYIVDGGTGAGAYTDGTVVTLVEWDAAGLTGIVNVPGTGTNGTLRLNNIYPSKITAVGGNYAPSTYDDVTLKTWEYGATATWYSAGASKTLVSASTLADATEMQVMFALESVGTTAGVTGGAGSTAIFQLQLKAGASVVPIANLIEGDVFYTSQMSNVFLLTTGTGTTAGDFVLKNTSGTAYAPTFKFVVASKV